MAEYDIKINKVSREVIQVDIYRKSTNKAITVHVSGDELAGMIIERGKLAENLIPPQFVIDSFKKKLDARPLTEDAEPIS